MLTPILLRHIITCAGNGKLTHYARYAQFQRPIEDPLTIMGSKILWELGGRVQYDQRSIEQIWTGTKSRTNGTTTSSSEGQWRKASHKRITEHVSRIPSLPHEAPVNAEHISFLPEGNSILVPPCVIHRDPRYYFSPSLPYTLRKERQHCHQIHNFA